MLFGFFTCKEALARLDEFVDRELAPHEHQQVERHVRLCLCCARKFRFQQGFASDLKAKLARVESVSPGLLQRLRRELAAAPPPAPEPHPDPGADSEYSA